LRADFPAASLVEAQIDLDQGRTEGALADLLDVVERNSNEVAGFVGLVTALRYAGLLQESVLAFKRVRQLDPEIMTSVEFTYVMLGDFAKARAESREPVMLLAYAAMVEGERAKGLAVLQGNPQMPRRFGRRAGLTLMVAALKGDLAGLKDLRALFGDFPDPEGHFQGAVFLAVLEQRDEALSWLGKAVDGGFFGIADAPMAAFARYREDPLYVDILRRAGERAGAVEQRLGERVRNVLA
jgi:hypothetical protein